MTHSIIPQNISLKVRALCVPLVNQIIKLKIMPHQLTWAGLVFALVAGLCAMKGIFLFAGIFALLAGLMDMLDGMVARQTQTESTQGVVLDSALDRYSDFFLLAGIIIKYKSFFINYYLGFLSLVGSFMVSYAQAKGEALQVNTPSGFMKRPDRWAILILALLCTSLKVLGHIPMFLALLALAIGTNYAAITRLKKIALAAQNKK